MEKSFISSELNDSFLSLVDSVVDQDEVIRVDFNSIEWNIVNTLLFEVHNYYADLLPEGNKKYDAFMEALFSAYDKVNNAETHLI